MQNIVRKETITIDVFFSSAETKPVFKYLFPDNENLRNAKIWGFQMYYNDVLKNDLLYKHKLIQKGDLQSTFVDMYDKKNINFLIFAPAVTFQTIQDNEIAINTRDKTQINERDAKFFCGQLIDIRNCYLSIVNNANLTKDTIQTYVVDVYYSRIGLDEGINPIKYN